jgi:hypothetical protein
MKEKEIENERDSRGETKHKLPVVSRLLSSYELVEKEKRKRQEKRQEGKVNAVIILLFDLCLREIEKI